MTAEIANRMLKAKLECMKRESSGSDEVCNRKACDDCYLNYDQGTIGEQKECLQLAIEALELYIFKKSLSGSIYGTTANSLKGDNDHDT